MYEEVKQGRMVRDRLGICTGVLKCSKVQRNYPLGEAFKLELDLMMEM